MTHILTTTLIEEESAEFLPVDEVILQATGSSGAVIIDVFARVDADADWSPITSWTLASGAFKRIAAFPRMKVKVRNNAALTPVTVRSS